MAKYGAQYLQWAKIQSDADPTKLPTYEGAINLGRLQKVSDSPNFNEAKAGGDDATREVVKEMADANVDVEILELLNETAEEVLGAEIDEGEDLHHKIDDNGPPGGMAFYTTRMIDKQKRFKGIFYPCLQAAMVGEEYETKGGAGGGSISLTGGKLSFIATGTESRDWKIESKLFDKEADAKAWVDAKLPPKIQQPAPEQGDGET